MIYYLSFILQKLSVENKDFFEKIKHPKNNKLEKIFGNNGAFGRNNRERFY